MNSIITRYNLADFLNDPDNAQRLNGLVEDIRHALVDYQVCTPEQFARLASNTWLRLRYKEIYTIRAVKRS